MPIAETGGLSGVVTTGPLLLAVLVSVLVGVVGFASPCVLPLVPGYLSYVTGLTGANEAEDRRPLGRILAGAALFVLGFTVVFVAVGALFGQLSDLITEHNLLLQRIFGAITIVLGLVFLGAFRPLQREVKFHRLPRAGLVGAPLVGATFGFAWTPCLTPTLTAVVGLSVSESTAGRGAVLAFAYCVGLGVPFLLVALGVGWATSAVGFLRRHAHAVSRVGGGFLVVLGVLLVTGAWEVVIRWLQGQFGVEGIAI